VIQAGDPSERSIESLGRRSGVPDSFVHLHQHTEYSMLDGAARIGDVVASAAADGQPAMGITDHGNMYGILPFYKECRAQGVKPIIGTEAYMAHESRSERPARRGRLDDSGGDVEGGKKLYYHLTLLAESNAGYKNLIQLASRAYLEGYYYKPRCDWQTLADHSEGVIATTGCLGGHVLQALMNSGFDAALEKAGRLQDIFGRDNLFVELQDHGIPEQRRTNPQLLEIARRIGAPLLATNDSHYVHRGDAVAHDALLCVQTGSLMSDADRFKFHGDEHYLKTAAEMRRLFDELPSACDNSLWIAERCDVEIEFGKPQLPNFPLPEGFTDDAAYLEHLTFAGAKQRWGDQLSDEVVERLAYELKVIGDMGFSSYFLITWDLIRHAKDAGIRVGPGRGSAAGCAVAYCLRITELDPIRYDLLFERFLNPSRISMPDIDMDFDSRYRDEMIRYAAERYGRDHVAQIVTFSTIKARAAVRDAARVLGQPYAVGDRIAKAMPPLIMGRDTPLRACLEEDPKFLDGYKMAAELREMYDADPDIRKVIDVAKGLEGLRRQDGIHAAAVVITKEPLTEHLPIQRKPESGQAPEDAPVVTQYEMGGVEELGLLKMDFLGLRNLDVITDTLELIRATRGVDVDIDAVPLDDPATYELLQRAETIGVFQLEGGPMRALMRSLAPTEFDDVAALVALYRPGPMAANMHNDYADRKNGRKPVEYLHPDAAEVLGDTYGLMVYQESMMRVAQQFAGYSLADADNLRKACFPAGTRMLTRSRGYVPIERVPEMSDRRVQVIDEVSAATRFEEVEDVWSVGVKPVYRLTTSTGYAVEATANHPFLVDDRWTELGEVCPGDRVAVAGTTRTHGGSHISDAQVALSALLISEGCATDVRGVAGSAFCCNTDPELVEAFAAAYEAHFGRAHTRREVVAGVTRMRLILSELVELEPVVGHLGRSAEKVIPWGVVNAPKRKVERFLGLYFCAGGWVDGSGANLGSASLEICRSLKRMLLRLGVVADLLHRDIPGHGRHWVVSIADKGQARRFLAAVDEHLTSIQRAKVRRAEVAWSGGSSATNIGIPACFVEAELTRRREVTGPSRRSPGVDTGAWRECSVIHRDTVGTLLHSERLEDLSTGDLVWDTVVSVEPVGEKECFDFRMANADRPYAVVEDFLVHNCGKKNKELIAKERAKFIAGCDATGFGADLGHKWFDIIEPFADYAFNKSHAFGYGYVAYQTAYLKANYPAEYLAALLTSVKTSLEKAAVYLAECRTMGIEVVVPDVNRSASDFTPDLSEPDRPRITFGLSAVRNVGEGLVELIVEERDAGGPFADFYDFCERVNTGVLNKRTIESLIKAGGFDSLGHPRKGLLQVFEQIVDQTVARRKEHDMGVMSLFGDTVDGPSFDERARIPDVEFDKKERLAFEKEMLGLYVSDHPLLGAEKMLRRKSESSIAELEDLEDGTRRTVGGVITSLVRKWTRKGDLMAVFTLEDLQGSIEVMVFPKTMAAIGHLLAEDAVVLVGARLDRRDDTPKLIATDLELFEPMAEGPPPLRLHLNPLRVDDAMVNRLKELFGDFPGDSEVHILLGERQVLHLSDDFLVSLHGGLVGELRALLGVDAVLL
jgi:DNA polymerase-3 subunit alpha